jgi:flagellar biosynthesis/type III secretory pathway chaperone
MFLKLNKQTIEKTISQSALLGKLNKCLLALITTLENENKLLENGSMSQIEPAVNAKIIALQAFEKMQKEVADFTKKIQIDQTDSFLPKLKQNFIRLDEVSEKNEILLMSNIEVGSKMADIYKEHKKTTTIQQHGYNKEGKIVSSKNLEKFMPSISLNDKI